MRPGSVAGSKRTGGTGRANSACVRMPLIGTADFQALVNKRHRQSKRYSQRMRHLSLKVALFQFGISLRAS